jgi:hypothetical protein
MLFNRLEPYPDTSVFFSVTNQIELGKQATTDRIVKDSEVITAIPLPLTGQC